jgi:hypothetical protein
MKVMSYILGLDLGQVADFTALTICEVRQKMTEPFVDAANELRPAKPGKEPPSYFFGHIQRYRRNTPYQAIVDDLVRKVHRLAGDYVIVPDQTGVGRPVVEMLAKARLKIVPVTITGGTGANFTGGSWHVPKRELVSCIAVLFQAGRVTFSKHSLDTPALVQELQNFRAKISVGGTDTYEAWREGVHDDLVLAAALACWWAERGNGKYDVY